VRRLLCQVCGALRAPAESTLGPVRSSDSGKSGYALTDRAEVQGGTGAGRGGIPVQEPDGSTPAMPPSTQAWS
jgi:hypothetical protein